MTGQDIPDGAVTAYITGLGDHLADDRDTIRPCGVSHDSVRAGFAAAYPLLAAQALREAADALRACRTCGKAHKLRRVSADHEVLRESWACPDDGHWYRPMHSSMHEDEIATWLDLRAVELEREGGGDG